MRAARELLKDLKYEVLSGSIDVNVSELVYNTRKVKKECMFVCIQPVHGLLADLRQLFGDLCHLLHLRCLFRG